MEIPASKFKAELARILDEQGYIEGYSTEPARVGEVLRVQLKYTEDRAPVISGHQARVHARPPHLRRTRGEIPQDPRRHGHHDHVHVQGVMTGHEARAQGRRRRSRRLRLVMPR